MNSKQVHQETELAVKRVEKEQMTGAVNHRFRNDMQLIISLLNNQIHLQPDTAIKHELQKIQQRIYVVSRAFDHLHATSNLTSMAIRPYLHNLLDHLKHTYQDKSPVSWDIDIASLTMSSSDVIPIGLIIHEAVSNALQYAFPELRSGHIAVRFTASPNKHLQLQITDDGIGIHQPPSPGRETGLGLPLIEGLTRQLGGSYKLTHDNGVQISITFVRLQYEADNTPPALVSLRTDT